MCSVLNCLDSTICTPYLSSQDTSIVLRIDVAQLQSLRPSDLPIAHFRRCRITGSRGLYTLSAQRPFRCVAVTLKSLDRGVARAKVSDAPVKIKPRKTYKLAFFNTLRPLLPKVYAKASYVRACHRLPPALHLPTFTSHSQHQQRKSPGNNWRTMATLGAQRKHKVTVVGSGNW